MYYLVDYSNAEFARKKGSKDKSKRKNRLLKGALAVGGLGILALGIKHGRQARQLSRLNTPNSVPDIVPDNFGKLTPKQLIEKGKLDKDLRRLKLISKETKELSGKRMNRLIRDRDNLNKAVKQVRQDTRLSETQKTRIVDKIKRRIKTNQNVQRTGALNAVKNNANYSWFLSDFIVEFARKKGSKDKTKRKRNLLGKVNTFLNGEKDNKTGKRNVTLREPVIKRAAIGAIGGGVIGTGLLASNAAYDYKKHNLNESKIKVAKAVLKNTLKYPVTKAAIGTGLVLGVGSGVGKYLSRKKDIKKYQIKPNK